MLKNEWDLISVLEQMIEWYQNQILVVKENTPATKVVEINASALLLEA